MLLIQGVLTVTVAVWSGARLLPSLAAPELVAVIAVAGGLLLAVATLGGILVTRGAMLLRHARRGILIAGLTLQPPFLTAFFFFSLLHAALWLFGVAAVLAALAGAALAWCLRLGRQLTA